MHTYLSIVALAFAISLSVFELSAQEPTCPNRGCRLNSGSDSASGTVSSCAGGLRFKLNGIEISPSQDMCPQFIQIIPPHFEVSTDPSPNKWTRRGGEFFTYMQAYECRGLGCSYFGLFSCCKRTGPLTVGNTLYNCQSENCIEFTFQEPDADPDSLGDPEDDLDPDNGEEDTASSR